MHPTVSLNKTVKAYWNSAYNSKVVFFVKKTKTNLSPSCGKKQAVQIQNRIYSGPLLKASYFGHTFKDGIFKTKCLHIMLNAKILFILFAIMS